MEILSIFLTTLLSAITLFIIAKVMGHKQIAQLDFFDYITGITIGSIAAELATELETPWQPFLATVFYGLIAIALTMLTSKFSATRKYINGTPTVIMTNGKIYRENMKKAKLDLSEFMLMCRQEGYFDLSAIHTAILEYNGKLSILPTAGQRPLTPADMSLAPEQAHICTEIIMDGRILEENLKRRGLDLTWLDRQLEAQGYNGAENVFLGLCDEENNLSLYPM